MAGSFGGDEVVLVGVENLDEALDASRVIIDLNVGPKSVSNGHLNKSRIAL